MIDLLHIESYQENNRIEAKLATGGFPQSLWETYSAFANTIGGLILLGVEELPDKTFRVVGVPDSEEYITTFWTHVNDPTKVSVNILSPKDLYVRNIGGKEVLAIEVPRADRRQRPVYLDNDPFRGTYRRDGEGDYHCSAVEVRSMLRDQADTPKDLEPLTDLTLDDLSCESIQAFRRRMRTHKPSHTWNYLSDEDFLQMTGIAVWDNQRQILHPTMAGLLLLGTREGIKKVLPRFKLEYQEAVEGGHTIHSELGSWSGNLLDFYDQVSDRLRAIAATLSPEDKDLEASLLEAATNAILHTDYFGGEGLHILPRPNVLEITNAGLFRIRPELAKKGRNPDSRNVGLTRLFALIGVGTGSGLGLRGIYSTWRRHGLASPVLYETFGPDTTNLRLPLRSFSRDPLQQKIVDYLTWEISASPQELSNVLGVSLRIMKKALSRLQSDGLVTRQEAPTSERYSLRS